MRVVTLIVGNWNFLGMSYVYSSDHYVTKFYYNEPAYSNWDKWISMDRHYYVSKFTEDSTFKTFIGGLLSESSANSYSEFFKGTIHFIGITP